MIESSHLEDGADSALQRDAGVFLSDTRATESGSGGGPSGKGSEKAGLEKTMSCVVRLSVSALLSVQRLAALELLQV